MLIVALRYRHSLCKTILFPPPGFITHLKVAQNPSKSSRTRFNFTSPSNSVRTKQPLGWAVSTSGGSQNARLVRKALGSPTRHKICPVGQVHADARRPGHRQDWRRSPWGLAGGRKRDGTPAGFVSMTTHPIEASDRNRKTWKRQEVGRRKAGPTAGSLGIKLGGGNTRTPPALQNQRRENATVKSQTQFMSWVPAPLPRSELKDGG